MALSNGQRVTSRDVAREAGVSQATVSNVLNHPQQVAPATRERVLQVIERIGFVVDEAARQLRAGRSTTLGMSVLDTGNPFWGEVMNGAADAAAEHGFVALVGSSNESRDKEARYLRSFREQRMAGLLVAPVDTDLSVLVKVAADGCPVVLLDYRDPSGRLPYVGVDDVRGASLVGEHLLDLGHRRIAFVNGPPTIPWCADRREGLHRAVRARGLDPEVAVTELRVSRLTAAEGQRAVTEQVAPLLGTGVTAVFCANDLIALGALRALQMLGIAVPQQVSLVGYDDDDFAEMLSAPLTTVRQQPYLLGQAAARLVLRLIEGASTDGRADDTERGELFEPELVPRESSAPPRS